MTTKVNQKGLAEILNLTARQVRNLTDDHGMPSEVGRSGQRVYDLTVVVPWYVDFKVTSSRGSDRALEEAKLQKEQLEVRRRQLEVAKAENEVIAIEDHRAVVERIGSAFRTSLLGVPGAWGPQVIGIVSAAEGTEVMQTCSEELLRDLAATMAKALEDAGDEDHFSEDGPLPDDFPGRSALEASGVTTWAQLRELGDDLERVKGIGPKTARMIHEFEVAA